MLDDLGCELGSDLVQVQLLRQLVFNRRWRPGLRRVRCRPTTIISVMTIDLTRFD